MSAGTHCCATQERQAGVTIKGKPFTLLGAEVKVGSQAPEFEVIALDMSPVTLASSKGKIRLISAVHSLDTGICDAETRRFNEEAVKLPGVEILTISMDLPFAQKRWCGAVGIDRIKVLSDHRKGSFGKAYGVQIKELRLLSRAIFVVDANDVVRYVESLPEVGAHPNYDAALAAVRQIAK